MSKELNLVEILGSCPRGLELYSAIYGPVKLESINTKKNPLRPICFSYIDKTGVVGYDRVTANGHTYDSSYGECTLFPSSDDQDWENFDENLFITDYYHLDDFKPFDRILVRNTPDTNWRASFFSHVNGYSVYRIGTTDTCYKFGIPYNSATENLIGTDKDCPEYFKWWKHLPSASMWEEDESEEDERYKI